MKLEKRIVDDLKHAMKAGEKLTVSTLRMLRSQIQNTAIAKSDDLSDDDILAIFKKEAKKRRESVDMYEKGGREDLAQIERLELEVISNYLPKALSESEVIEIVDDVIQSTGAAGINDLGRVMGQVMTRTQGRADGKMIQQLVREKLSN